MHVSTDVNNTGVNALDNTECMLIEMLIIHWTIQDPVFEVTSPVYLIMGLIGVHLYTFHMHMLYFF